MAKLIPRPTVIEAAGNKPKKIEEYFGRINSATAQISIARMVSPAGWVEPPQRPEFDEFTVVLHGSLTVRTDSEELEVKAGSGVLVERGERVQYSTPDGAEYIAVCLPAFSPETVHRE